jgi:hypothetical protein
VLINRNTCTIDVGHEVKWHTKNQSFQGSSLTNTQFNFFVEGRKLTKSTDVKSFVHQKIIFRIIFLDAQKEYQRESFLKISVQDHKIFTVK